MTYVVLPYISADIYVLKFQPNIVQVGTDFYVC